MEKRVLGKTGMEISVLGFGGAEIGYEAAAQETVETLLNSALDAGLNVIDTAECYANSEEMIGKAIAHRREEFFLFTKCGHSAGLPLPDWDPKMLEQSIERSLKRLQTETVDLIQLHSCSADVLKQGDVIAVLQKARDAGKTRFIGYSGDGENARYAVETGAFDTLQTSVSIADQQPLTLTLPLTQARNIGVIAKRPIANAVWKRDAVGQSDYSYAYWQRLRALDYDFLKFDLNHAIGLAMRFTLSVPGVHTAIVGTKNPSRWRENAALLAAGALPPDQFEAIRSRWNEVAQPDWTGQV